MNKKIIKNIDSDYSIVGYISWVLAGAAIIISLLFLTNRNLVYFFITFMSGMILCAIGCVVNQLQRILFRLDMMARIEEARAARDGIIVRTDGSITETFNM